MNGSFTESLHYWVNKINGPMWDGLIFVLLGVGLFFTLATGFVQFRLFGRSIREMLGGRKQGDDRTGLRRFRLSLPAWPAVWVWAISPAWPSPSVSAAGRGVLDVAGGLNRHEFGFAESSLRTFQNPRLRRPPFPRRTGLLYYAGVGTALVGHSVRLEPDFLFRFRI